MPSLRGPKGVGGYPSGRRGSLSVQCPKCGSGPGLRCKTLLASTVTWKKGAHPERVQLWKDMQSGDSS